VPGALRPCTTYVPARAGLIVMVVLLCLTPLFRNMPQNAQAAIIISAVAGLFNYSEAIFLWRVRRRRPACGPGAWPGLHAALFTRHPACVLVTGRATDVPCV